MATWNRSREVYSDPEQSGGGGSSRRPPLPRPEKGENVRPVPLWEREFCRKAYNIPWETFCQNKRFIEILFFEDIMDWDDSGALKNFKDAKERYRAKYFGEPYEDPVLDADLYIDEVDHHCKVDPKLLADLDKIATINLVADLGQGCISNLTPMSLGEPSGNLIPPGWGQPVPDLEPTGWGEPASPPPAAASGGHGNTETVREAHQAEGPLQQRNSSGMQRNQEGRHQQRSGGLQQLDQMGRRMEWHPLQQNRAPNEQ